MAIYYSRTSGNVNASNVWATTPTGTASAVTITSADVLMAQSGHTITINVNTTAQEIRNDNANGATAGGTFNLSDGVTLTANVFCGTTQVLAYSGASPNSASIIGSITGGTSGAASGAVGLGGSGTLNITGTITGGSGTGAGGVRMTAGTLNVTGNVFGSPTLGAAGVSVNGGTACNITGTVTGGAVANTGVGVNVAAAVATTISGAAVGGTAGEGVAVGAAATVTVTRAKGNGFGAGSTGLSAAPGVTNSNQSASVRVSELEFGDLGQSPTAGPIAMVDVSSNVCLMYRPSTTKKTLIDPAGSAGYPAASNVRSGTTYGNGNFTGTCAVPAAASVAFGVAVDNTTGTAVLTSAAAQSACNAALAAFSSGRLANVATVASTGQQIADAVTA